MQTSLAMAVVAALLGLLLRPLAGARLLAGLASAAAALKVTRPGTADAIPSKAAVQAFLA